MTKSGTGHNYVPMNYKMKKRPFCVRGFQTFLPSQILVCSGTKIGKKMWFPHPRCSCEQNRMLAVIDVDRYSPMKPLKASRGAQICKKANSPVSPRTVACPWWCATKLMRTEMAGKSPEKYRSKMEMPRQYIVLFRHLGMICLAALTPATFCLDVKSVPSQWKLFLTIECELGSLCEPS